jgi:hypothetical protein
MGLFQLPPLPFPKTKLRSFQIYFKKRIMKKSYIYLQFFLSLIIGLPVFSQAPKVDRIAIFYMHCNDVDPVKDKLISKKDLEEHYFSNKKDDEGYFLAEDSPIAKCLNINTNGLYKYKGNVFTDIKLPFSEEDFMVDQTKEDWKPLLPRIIELLAKQDKEEDQSLKIPGFEAAKYDKVIYLLGEKSLYSTGEWRGYAFMEEDLKTISINNVPVALPSASMKGVIKNKKESVSLPYSKKAPDEFFRKEYSEFGLWQYHDITTIHEWGHLLGLFHANMPCNLDNCKKYYQRFCPYSENFFCNNLDDNKKKRFL